MGHIRRFELITFSTSSEKNDHPKNKKYSTHSLKIVFHDDDYHHHGSLMDQFQ